MPILRALLCKVRCPPCTSYLGGSSCTAVLRQTSPDQDSRIERVDSEVVQLSTRVMNLEAMMNTRSSENSMVTSSSYPISRIAQDSASIQSVTTDWFGTSIPEAESAAKYQLSIQSLTVPHRIFVWPSVKIYLSEFFSKETEDLLHIAQDGTRWFLKCETTKHSRPLPSQDEESIIGSPWPLSADDVQEYTACYFRTFNMLLPILDYNIFVQKTLRKLSRFGYKYDDPEATVALLVFALGRLASESVVGEPISVSAGIPSGFRGGDLEHPPGLYLFNQARKRIGFVSSFCSLETVQIFLLQASYFEANAYHLEFCRAVMSASSTIHMLLKCRNFEWASQTGDMHSRAYWACLFHEDLYHLDLDFPSSGIDSLEDETPLPFSYTDSIRDEIHQLSYDQQSHSKHHFLAMITLRRLILMATLLAVSAVRVKSDQSADVPVVVIREMSRQLESWRSLLPAPLQWLDGDMLHSHASDSAGGTPRSPLFFMEQGIQPKEHSNNADDLMTAQLRSRFYYAKYILYRPFIYKALHFPELMSPSDADNCAVAINSACLWPFLMSPPRLKKRLVPHLFTWTQNSLGILIIFNMIESDESFRRICENRVDSSRIRETSALILDWIKDNKQVDGIAEWAWRVLQPLFR